MHLCTYFVHYVQCVSVYKVGLGGVFLVIPSAPPLPPSIFLVKKAEANGLRELKFVQLSQQASFPLIFFFLEKITI